MSDSRGKMSDGKNPLVIDVTKAIVNGAPLLGALYWFATLLVQGYYYARWSGYCPLPAKFLFVGTKGEYFWQAAGVFSPIDLVPTNSIGWRWLEDPRDWYGLHSVVTWLLEALSVGAFVFFVGIILAAIVAALSSAIADDLTKSGVR